MSVRYLFIARHNPFPEEGEDAIQIDSFYQVKSVAIPNETANAVAMKIDPERGKDDAAAYTAMQTRLRFNPDMWPDMWPHVLMVESPALIRREDMEFLLNAMGPDERNDWLKKASI